MATVTGSVGGQPFSFVTTSPLQASFVQQILNLTAQSATPSQSIATGTPGPVPLVAPVVFDTASTPNVVSGSASVPIAQVVLDGKNAAYVTGGTTTSTVIAVDNSSSAIVNSNPNGGLLAMTGAGPNVLAGFAGVNQFITGAGGQDAVFLDGIANNLTSNGLDAVLVGGPSTISAAPGGADSVLMTAGTTLSFINGSDLGSSITGAAGGSIEVAGSGATSVTAGAGMESFGVSTASGNVTLQGSAAGSDIFTFQDGGAGTAHDVVGNFTASDTVLLHGYAGYTIQADPSNPAGSMLTLSDGSQVSFTNASAAAVQARIKTV